jgi:hypothetical protein
MKLEPEVVRRSALRDHLPDVVRARWATLRRRPFDPLSIEATAVSTEIRMEPNADLSSSCASVCHLGSTKLLENPPTAKSLLVGAVDRLRLILNKFHLIGWQMTKL